MNKGSIIKSILYNNKFGINKNISHLLSVDFIRDENNYSNFILNKHSLLFDIKRVALFYNDYKKLVNWFEYQLNIELKFLDLILFFKFYNYDCRYLKKKCLSFLIGEEFVNYHVLDLLYVIKSNNMIKKWVSYEYCIMSQSYRRFKNGFDIIQTNPLNLYNSFHPLYIILSRLISMKCIPDDIFVNERYKYIPFNDAGINYKFSINLKDIIKSTINTTSYNNYVNLYRFPRWLLIINYGSLKIQQLLGLNHILHIIYNLRFYLTSKNISNINSLLVNYNLEKPRNNYSFRRLIYPLIYYWCLEFNLKLDFNHLNTKSLCLKLYYHLSNVYVLKNRNDFSEYYIPYLYDSKIRMYKKQTGKWLLNN